MFTSSFISRSSFDFIILVACKNMARNNKALFFITCAKKACSRLFSIQPPPRLKVICVRWSHPPRAIRKHYVFHSHLSKLHKFGAGEKNLSHENIWRSTRRRVITSYPSQIRAHCLHTRPTGHNRLKVEWGQHELNLFAIKMARGNTYGFRPDSEPLISTSEELVRQKSLHHVAT